MSLSNAFSFPVGWPSIKTDRPCSFPISTIILMLDVKMLHFTLTAFSRILSNIFRKMLQLGKISDFVSRSRYRLGWRKTPAYTYKDLDGDDEIRLLKVTRSQESKFLYEIVHTNLKDAPDFQAVSYAWGRRTLDSKLPLANGSYLPVTASIQKAIPFLSCHCSTGYLWIDQLCLYPDRTGTKPLSFLRCFVLRT